nr:uncharacterized protein LOC109148663 [Ipomoea batatas]
MFQFKDFGFLKASGGVDCNQLIGKLPFQCRFIFNVIQILCHVNVFIIFTDLIGCVVSIHQPTDIQVKQNSQRLIDFVIEDCR